MMNLLRREMGGWDAISRALRWNVPAFFNIAEAVCDRHAADPDKVAMFCEDESGQREARAFSEVTASSACKSLIREFLDCKGERKRAD